MHHVMDAYEIAFIIEVTIVVFLKLGNHGEKNLMHIIFIKRNLVNVLYFNNSRSTRNKICVDRAVYFTDKY